MASPSVLAVTAPASGETPFSFQAVPLLSVRDPNRSPYAYCPFSKRQPPYKSLCIDLQGLCFSVRFQKEPFYHGLLSACDSRIPFGQEDDSRALLSIYLYLRDPWTSNALNQLAVCPFAYWWLEVSQSALNSVHL